MLPLSAPYVDSPDGKAYDRSVIDAEAYRKAAAWDVEPAEEPFDLEVGPAEREAIITLYRWFSRFTPSEKLCTLARHQRLAQRLAGLSGARRR